MMAMLEVAHGTKPMNNITAAADQAGGQEHPRVGTVGDRTHDEFGEAVGDGNARQREAEVTAAETLFDQVRHGRGEVLTHQIVSGVTEEDPQKICQRSLR